MTHDITHTVTHWLRANRQGLDVEALLGLQAQRDDAPCNMIQMCDVTHEMTRTVTLWLRAN